MKNSKFNKEIKYLFDCDFFSKDFDPTGKEEHTQFANKLLSNNNWSEIFESIEEYVKENVKTEKQIVNFVNHYLGYGFARQVIDYPYQFIAYFFKRFDVDKNWDNGGETIDDFATSILDKCGYIDLVKNPYYNTAKDEKLLLEIEKIK